MIHVESLSVAYDEKEILEDVSLDMRACEITGIIGPNGSGKTTLLRAITRIVKPKAGKIFVDNLDVETLSNLCLAKKIAVVSQYAINAFDMNVEDYILLGRIPHRRSLQFIDSASDHNVAKNALFLVGMLDFGNRMLSSLSAGERQLVLIARAITQQTKVLLMDEPTSHLDIFHQIKILEIIKKLNIEKKLTFVIVMHDLNLASQFCKRLILLNDKKVRIQGTPEEIIKKDIIEEVYKIKVFNEKFPHTKKPFILPVSD